MGFAMLRGDDGRMKIALRIALSALFALGVAATTTLTLGVARAEVPTMPAGDESPVELNVRCNDGTISPTCEVCRRGCCSHHGGCR